MNASPIRCLITAGPTREHLDPVRFLSNGSSGKMGYALAAAAASRGWQVDLISGPVSLVPPAGVTCHRVVSAEEMLQCAQRLFLEARVLIMCAAVADYRPAISHSRKMKKQLGNLTIEMEPTPDIARRLGADKGERRLIGFAAETDNLEAEARRKLREKNMDWIVANRVGGEGCAMESDLNRILLLGAGGERLSFGPAPKGDVAHFILEQTCGNLETRSGLPGERSGHGQ